MHENVANENTAIWAKHEKSGLLTERRQKHEKSEIYQPQFSWFFPHSDLVIVMFALQNIILNMNEGPRI